MTTDHVEKIREKIFSLAMMQAQTMLSRLEDDGPTNQEITLLSAIHSMIVSEDEFNGRASVRQMLSETFNEIHRLTILAKCGLLEKSPNLASVRIHLDQIQQFIEDVMEALKID